jgi:hypothetical protein
MLVDTDHDYVVLLEGAGSKISFLYPITIKALRGTDQTIQPLALLQCVCCGLGVEWEVGSTTQIGSAKFGSCVYIPAAIWPTTTQSRLSRIRVVRGAFIYRDTYFSSLSVNEGKAESRRWGNGRPGSAPSTDQDETTRRTLASITYTARDQVDDLLVSVILRDNLGYERTANPLRAAWRAACAVEVQEEDCSIKAHQQKNNLIVQQSRGIVAHHNSTSSSHNTADIPIIDFVGDQTSCFYSCDLPQRPIFFRGGCVGCAAAKAISMRGILINLSQPC